ncbi:MAG: SPASM domain-containing protein, partial [Pseudomonadota bacterium]
SIAGMDDYHVGMEGSRREPLQDRLTRWLEAAGADQQSSGPHYGFFGATEEAWIGKLWPRGRAWENDLSTATLADNFCHAWSGGLGFLEYAYNGSEVSIDPTGDVYPCCLKTEAPLGNLVEEPLLSILDSLAGHPVFEAINAGRPERMGLTQGWSVEDFVDASATTTASGRPYRNLCIGCDAFHRQVLGPQLAQLRAERLAASPGQRDAILFRSRA